jgi:hypothetical protein
MKWVKKYSIFKESLQSSKIKSKDIIKNICTSMVLLNNEFLDPLLDKGLKARYSENSNVFITDLKNLLLSKNRLKLGTFENDKCIVSDNIPLINSIFNQLEFDIEKDWKLLIDSRNTARNIIDKMFSDKKLQSDNIKSIYLILQKDNDNKEDIVIETSDGKQYSFYLNKNLSTSKTASFNLFADDLIGDNIDKLFKEEYLSKWNKLVQQWVKIIYENANKKVQKMIENFIDPKRIDDLQYFEYFDIRHKDPKYKYLGEYISDFDKNILKFSDLMNEIWKNRENCIYDIEKATKEWHETKIVILNSKILENLLTSSLKSNNIDDIKRMDDGWKMASGNIKMKLFKNLVEKMDCLEKPIYYLGKNGDIFNLVPSRDFFRKNYDNLDMYFDYHVNFTIDDEDENNDFKIKLKLNLEDDVLINMFVIVKFSGGEMSGKLSAIYKFKLADNFNYLISKLQQN